MNGEPIMGRVKKSKRSKNPKAIQFRAGAMAAALHVLAGPGLLVYEPRYPAWWYPRLKNDSSQEWAFLTVYSENLDVNKEYALLEVRGQITRTSIVIRGSSADLFLENKKAATFEAAIAGFLANNDQVAAAALKRWSDHSYGSLE